MRRAATTWRWLCAALATAGLALGQGPIRESTAVPRWIETFVPRMPSAEAQLAHARSLKRKLAGQSGSDLDFWRQVAVEAYQAVRTFHPGARSIAAEAEFRAGELLRAAEQDERALQEFRRSALDGEGTEFRARARLEIGHLERRHERWRAALESYLEVAADSAARASHRDEAWLWAGNVWKALGRLDDARAAWRRVVEQGGDDAMRVQAYDELCCSSIALDDLEGAAGLLDECFRGLSARALEQSVEGQRLRNALVRMRVIDELPRAIARRKDSSATGRKFEKVLTR